MQIWRITKTKYATSAFTGEGARQFGGRWNSQGIAVVYGSSSLSLAALEMFVHMEISDANYLSLVAISATIPETVEKTEITATMLPDNWRSFPAPSSLARLGDNWVRSNATVALIVPSVIIPQEKNILLNPNHPDFSQIQVHEAQPFSFDSRMWK
ncbi:RES family NAD+ phosphorylase [Synechococcus sp. C9]|uniref:RES family NAD+ phosphorylase n=1 Tax=Synechococcus sp. C9 TaxID=102119 RepID=UPI001FF1377F|nr:RES family NAD+ phosphorylase [Synechococcus sp. C9]